MTNLQVSQRNHTIDVFRALTMLCMIFVNDLGSLTGVPHWLTHAGAGEDFLGFSDIVFPAFLFVMGMSIPLSIHKRLDKGDSIISIIGHILLRSVALIIMGLFSVNISDGGVSAELIFTKQQYVLLMILGFFLLWNNYPKGEGGKKWLFLLLRVVGFLLLAYLAFIYRSKTGEWMQIRWWGILGLIGWAYVITSLIYLWLRDKKIYLLVPLVLFLVLNMFGASEKLGVIDWIIPGNGSGVIFALLGVIISLFFVKFRDTKKSFKLNLVIIWCGLGLIGAGFISHNWWIINKLGDTPTWIFFCSGIIILFYMIIDWLVHIKGKANWFNIIKPAGVATLTCFLIPSVLYNVFSIFKVTFPEWFVTWPMGCVKSLLFAFLTIGVTWVIGKLGIKLKI